MQRARLFVHTLAEEKLCRGLQLRVVNADIESCLTMRMIIRSSGRLCRACKLNVK